MTRIEVLLLWDKRIVGRGYFDFELPDCGRLTLTLSELFDPLPANARVEVSIADLTPDHGMLPAEMP